MKEKNVLRIIDANLNRLREALRVCEEITRFSIEDKNSTAKLKKIRHEILKAVTESNNLKYASLVSSRDAIGDIGKDTIPEEAKRDGVSDVLNANLQRAKESVRVLEEFSKVVDQKSSLHFKKIRFEIYDIEKVLIERI